jgi:hypothetical protein
LSLYGILRHLGNRQSNMEKFYEKYEKPAVLLNANVADEIYMANL